MRQFGEEERINSNDGSFNHDRTNNIIFDIHQPLGLPTPGRGELRRSGRHP